MGRHRAEQSSSGVAKELIYAVLGIVVVLALLVGWFLLRDSNKSSHNASGQCPAGNLTIPTAFIGAAVDMTSVQQEFLATKPVVQDYCVTEFSTTELSKAAIVYSDNSDQDTKIALKQAKKSATNSDWPTLELTDIGIAVPDTQNAAGFADWSTITDVSLVSEDSLAATIAKQSLPSAPNMLVPEASAVASKSPFVTSRSSVPAGYTFVVPDQPSALQLPTRALAITTSDGVTEEQSRAATAFLEFASSNTKTKLDGPAAELINQAVTIAPLPKEAPAAAKPAAAKRDTLIVLDTSDKMTPMYDEVASSLSERIATLGASGYQVGLWNYSSPLSAGVTKGWRPNVPLPDESKGANAAAAVTHFGTGGSSFTHEATVAALLSAGEVAAQTKNPVNVVIISTGTDDAGSQGDLTATLQAIDSKLVTLHLINIGAEDGQLAAWAKSHEGTSVTVTDANERNQAIDKALGLS